MVNPNDEVKNRIFLSRLKELLVEFGFIPYRDTPIGDINIRISGDKITELHIHDLSPLNYSEIMERSMGDIRFNPTGATEASPSDYRVTNVQGVDVVTGTSTSTDAVTFAEGSPIPTPSVEMRRESEMRARQIADMTVVDEATHVPVTEDDMRRREAARRARGRPRRRTDTNATTTTSTGSSPHYYPDENPTTTSSNG